MLCVSRFEPVKRCSLSSPSHYGVLPPPPKSSVWDMGDALSGGEDADLLCKTPEELRAILKDMIGIEARLKLLISTPNILSLFFQ